VQHAAGEAFHYGRRFESAAFSRNTRFKIFPEAVFGKASTKRTC